jgi:hypothetical protein
MVRDRRVQESARGQIVAKDKKKSKKTKKKGVLAAVSSSKAGKRIKAMTGNAQIGDVVAAALVATAAALKDSNKARRLAASAGDELTALSKKGAEQGNAMWQLALDIGQRAMDSILGDQASRPGRPATRRKAAAPRKAATARKATTARKAAGSRKTATAKKAAAPRAAVKKTATPRKTATAPKRTSRPTGRTARKRTQPKPN